VPDWQEAASWFAGTIPEIRRMLLATERIMNGRKRRRSRERWTDAQRRERIGRGAFTPTAAEPLLVVVIEESPDVLADEVCRRIAARLGKKGRKHGIVLIVVTQVPSLAELGGDLTIRSMLSSTNIVMFRTSDRLSKQMGMPGDLPVDPAALPAAWPDGSGTAGLGYLAAAGGRISPMRAQYVEDPFHWATVEGDVAELEQTAIEDAGAVYATWRERRAAGLDERDDPAPTSKDDAARPRNLDSGRLAGRQGTTREAILAHLKYGGEIHSGPLARDLDVPLPTVSSALRRLEHDGHAIQVRHGVWAHPDHVDIELDDHDGSPVVSRFTRRRVS
jgi:DNA-binding transcriptional ArsR family regulator